jgi:hypothetical protein
MSTVCTSIRRAWRHGIAFSMRALCQSPFFADARPEEEMRVRYPLRGWKPKRKNWLVRLIRRLRGEHHSVDPITGQEYSLSDEARAAFKEVEGEKSPGIEALEQVLNHRDMRDVISDKYEP